MALADKIDTLTGFWAIDEKPTGSKDPFALRRAALGLLRLIVERNIEYHPGAGNWIFALSAGQNFHIDPGFAELSGKPLGQYTPEERMAHEELVAQAQARSHDRDDADVKRRNAVVHDLVRFLNDRLSGLLKDQGIRHDVLEAVRNPLDTQFTLIVRRARDLQAVLNTDDGANLIQGFKRANNILTQAEEKDGVSYELDPNPKFAENDAEKALFKALDEAAKVITPAMEAEDFASAMSAMAKLRAPIDAFFEDTKINTDNDIIRRNRMCLLHRIRTICGGVADLTKLES